MRHLRLHLAFLILVILFAVCCSPEPRRRSKSPVDDHPDAGDLHDAADNNTSPGVCGNGIFEPGELCDPGIVSGPGACPTSCDDGNTCTEGRLVGDASACTAHCVFDPVSVCQGGDGCCPVGCTPNQDSDCVPGCGDGVLDPGESCDPGIESGPGSCPTACNHSNTCLSGTLEGNASICTARCVYEEITQCQNDDGCCPAGCTSQNDNDCSGGCTPLTCAQAGVQCGATDNGCGQTMNCPGCPDGQTCHDGQCHIDGCTPLTCAQAGVQCGATDNGCGSTMNCPGCPDGQTCHNGQCQAGCTPLTCAQAGVQCGPADNGCGQTMNCPNCPSGQSCSNGQCRTTSTGNGAVGDACTSAGNCAGPGAICITEADFKNGYCTRSCESDASCPSGSHCVNLNGGRCAKTCTQSSQCRDGYLCYSRYNNVTATPEGEEVPRECAPAATGTRGPGDPCTAVWQCGGGTFGECRTDWPGGYCTELCVPFLGTECPAGSTCDMETVSCLKNCNSNADCRSGYSCVGDAFFGSRCKVSQ